jgi:hypothetical protein
MPLRITESEEHSKSATQTKKRLANDEPFAFLLFGGSSTAFGGGSTAVVLSIIIFEYSPSV